MKKLEERWESSDGFCGSISSKGNMPSMDSRIFRFPRNEFGITNSYLDAVDYHRSM